MKPTMRRLPTLALPQDHRSRIAGIRILKKKLALTPSQSPSPSLLPPGFLLPPSCSLHAVFFLSPNLLDLPLTTFASRRLRLDHGGLTTRHLIRIQFESSPGLYKRANEEVDQDADQDANEEQTIFILNYRPSSL